MTAQLPRTGSRGRRLVRDQRLAREVTWLAVAARILRSRDFHDQVIVGAIVLAGLAGLGREELGHALARARVWSRKLDQRAARAIEAGKR